MTDDRERPTTLRPSRGGVVRVMLPVDVAARADRIGGLGQAALTALVMRLLEKTERGEATPR